MWLAKSQRPAGVRLRDTISREKSVRKLLQNICEQEKSYSLSKSSFSVLLLLISTLSLKLKLQLLFCSELPISPYIFHQPKYWAYRKVIFRVSSAWKSFYHLAHLVCQILAFFLLTSIQYKRGIAHQETDKTKNMGYGPNRRSLVASFSTEPIITTTITSSFHSSKDSTS